jgi:hypothetical protein
MRLCMLANIPAKLVLERKRWTFLQVLDVGTIDPAEYRPEVRKYYLGLII